MEAGCVVTTRVQKRAGYSMRSPFPPPWPWHVDPELGLLMAFVDIVEAQAAQGQREGKCLECDGAGCETCEGSGRRSHAGDAESMAAAFASALRRLEAREQGKLSAADRKRDGEPIYQMTDEIRALFGAPRPVEALIGGWEDGEKWVPGLAGLTPAEQETLWHHIHGLSRASIALALTFDENGRRRAPRARRFGRAGAPALGTISKYLWRARVKLRKVFALAPEGEAAYLAALDAEEDAAERQERAVNAARASDREAEERRRDCAWPEPWEEDFMRFGLDDLLDPLEDEENPEGEPWLP